jgi:DNA-binding transcriptional LysR family regulator
MVAASEVEAGFVQLPCDFPGVKSELLFTEALALLVSAEDPLVSRKKVEVRHLEKRPMILYRGQLRLQVLELCRASGFEPVVACECEELETVRALVRSGLGVAIIPEIAAKPLLADPRTKALRLDKGLRRSVGVITRLHFPESTPLRHFLSLLSPRGVS